MKCDNGTIEGGSLGRSGAGLIRLLIWSSKLLSKRKNKLLWYGLQHGYRIQNFCLASAPRNKLPDPKRPQSS